MKINPGKINAVSFTKVRVRDRLKYFLPDQVIPGESSCKYLAITLHSDSSRSDHVNYTAKKDWTALHFTMLVLEKANSNTKILAYTSLVRPVLEYGAAC
jgi:hypothetical protein